MEDRFIDINIYADASRKFLKAHGINRYKTKKIDEMSDRAVITACHAWYEENGLQRGFKAFEKIYCPDWYWYGGLHDAEIIEIIELTLEPDYKEKPYKYNCLEIEFMWASGEYKR